MGSLQAISPGMSQSSVYGNINAAINQTNLLTDTMSSVQQRLDTYLNTTTSLSTRVAALEGGLDASRASILDLGRRADSYDFQIGSLASRATGWDTDLAGLHVTTDELSAKASAAATAIDALEDRANDLTGRVGAVEANKADISNLDALGRTVLFQRDALIPAHERPGETPVLFAQVAGPRALGGIAPLAAVLPAALSALGDNGAVCRVTGATTVSLRGAQPIEAVRAYRARWIMQRRQNPSDPAGDALQVGLSCLDQSGVIIGTIIVVQVDALRSSEGRRSYECVLARMEGDRVTHVVPPRTRYVRPFFRHFGDGLTDLEVLAIGDVTDAVLQPPVSADVIGRLATIESLDLGDRTTALEAAVSGPHSLTLQSKTEAASTPIPESVTTVRLLGQRQPGDGGDGLYVRAGSAGGADVFVSGGVTWTRVFLADEILTATLAGWFSRLPTSPPARSGAPWRDYDGLAWTPLS